MLGGRNARLGHRIVAHALAQLSQDVVRVEPSRGDEKHVPEARFVAAILLGQSNERMGGRPLNGDKLAFMLARYKIFPLQIKSDSVNRNGYLGFYDWSGASGWRIEGEYLVSAWNGQRVGFDSNGYAKADNSLKSIFFSRGYNGALYSYLVG